MSSHRTLAYLLLSLLTISLLTACDFNATPEPTPLPFARYTAQDVIDILTTSGVSAQNIQRDITAGRGEPMTYTDRYTFEIRVRDIAPNGGQIIVFTDPAALKGWEEYITTQRANAETRRNWIYTFTHANIILQVNANLTNDEANAYKAALERLS